MSEFTEYRDKCIADDYNLGNHDLKFIAKKYNASVSIVERALRKYHIYRRVKIRKTYKLSKDQIIELQNCYLNQMSNKEIAKKFGISLSTEMAYIERYKKEIGEYISKEEKARYKREIIAKAQQMRQNGYYLKEIMYALGIKSLSTTYTYIHTKL